MHLIARLLLLVPAAIAGWFVAEEDPRYWIVAGVIAMVFIALSATAGIYLPRILGWFRRGE